MREKINENPQVQMAVLGGLALLGVLYFLVLSGGGAVETDAGPAAATGASATGATTPGGATTVDPATPGATGGSTAPDPVAGDPKVAKLVPGPGLPAKVIKPYADGKIVAILFYNRESFDDRALKRTVENTIADDKKVALFIEQPRKVANYSRITQGVGLDRTPALVTIKPRSATEGQPVASVSYGFSGPKAVKQAIRDAAYSGGQITTYP